MFFSVEPWSPVFIIAVTTTTISGSVCLSYIARYIRQAWARR